MKQRADMTRHDIAHVHSRLRTWGAVARHDFLVHGPRMDPPRTSRDYRPPWYAASMPPPVYDEAQAAETQVALNALDDDNKTAAQILRLHYRDRLPIRRRLVDWARYRLWRLM